MRVRESMGRSATLERSWVETFSFANTLVSKVPILNPLLSFIAMNVPTGHVV